MYDSALVFMEMWFWSVSRLHYTDGQSICHNKITFNHPSKWFPEHDVLY
uniref:Uncharacterized protein n=1 Tax=Anguilla anguilla TaxID=7936 RepID=A0A0E9WF88_ANGAN